MKTLSRVFFYLFVAVLTVALVDDAVAQKKDKKKKKKRKATERPEWIDKPGLYEDVIIAAGLGSGFAEQKARSQAEQSGRTKIAQTLETELKALTTNFMEEAGTTNEKGSESNAQEYFSEVSQSLTKQTLKGVFVEEYWTDPNKVGNKMNVYAKMVLKKSAVLDAYKEQIKEDLAQKKIKAVKASADDALGALDKAIDTWNKQNNLGEQSVVEGSKEDVDSGGGE